MVVTQGWKDGAYEYWPVTRADLDPHYCRVEKVLNAQTYPLYQPPYDRTAKTLALKHAAGELGLHWYLPKLAADTILTRVGSSSPATAGSAMPLTFGSSLTAKTVPSD